MRKTLIVVGITLVLIGLAWPWVAKLPLGRLPGDIVIERPGIKFYFPVTTMVLISLVLSAIIYFFRR